MAKAEKQVTRWPVFEGKRLKKGDIFRTHGHNDAERYRFLGYNDQDDTIIVKQIPEPEDKWDPATYDLDTEEVREGVTLHLMDEEARTIVAAMQVIARLEEVSSSRRKPYPRTNALDGNHDSRYWADRVDKALRDAGYRCTGSTLTLYYQLGKFFQEFFRVSSA